MSSGFAAQTTQPETLYQNFLVARQFDDADIEKLGLQLLDPDETRDLLGHTREWSIKLPYFGMDGQETGFSRVRLLFPKSKMKYSQPRASGSHIYFPPGVAWKQVAQDVDVPIIITEGEFKAWQITKQITADGLNYAALGLAGVTSWTDKSGLHLHKDLMAIAWQRKASYSEKHRKVYIVFDYDGAEDGAEPNEQVAMAETKLAVTLRGLGAEVHLCRVGKFGPGKGSKYAIDDHLLSGGSLGQVLTATTATLNGIDTLETRLYEFKTRYALHNGDVIRLDDGMMLSWHKAKIDSAQHFFVQVTQRQNGTTSNKTVYILDAYKDWSKRCNIKQVGIFPEFQGMRITPTGCYNYLNAWAYEPLDGDPQPYLDFCTYFFRDEPDFAEYWHNWVANIIQQPWRRNYTTPQFASHIEGIGKSAIAEFIAEMMGTGLGNPAAITGPDELFSVYNGGLQGKLFVVVNEPSSDREDHSAKLKNYITSNEIDINNKYGAKYSVTNYLNFVFTTNKPYVTHMGESARREAIYSPTTLTNKETHPKVMALMEWARKKQGFSIVLNWYMNRDLSGFDPKAAAPRTKYRDKAIQLSKTPLEAFAQELKDWVDTHMHGVAAFSTGQLQVLCERWGHDSKAKTQYIRKALQAQGEMEPNKLIKVHGKPQRFTTIITQKNTHSKESIIWSRVAEDTETAITRELEMHGSF